MHCPEPCGGFARGQAAGLTPRLGPSARLSAKFGFGVWIATWK